MKHILFKFILVAVLMTCAGCVSTSINDSLALIEQQQNSTVNEDVLTSIQALRVVSKQPNQAHTFSYHLLSKELSHEDRLILGKLLLKKNHEVIVNIAPAQGEDKLQQLTLAMERAKIIQQYIVRFNKKVVINFSPKLPLNTLNLIIEV